MTSRIEALKQRSIQYEIELVKERLTDELAQQLVEALPELSQYSILSAPVSTKTALATLADLAKEFRQRLPNSLREDLREELAEIREDLNWSLSKQGKAVFDLESWVRSTRAELKDFQSVFVGRSFHDPMVLIINGVVADELERRHVVDRIEALQPPVQPQYGIELSIEA